MTNLPSTPEDYLSLLNSHLSSPAEPSNSNIDVPSTPNVPAYASPHNPSSSFEGELDGPSAEDLAWLDQNRGDEKLWEQPCEELPESTEPSAVFAWPDGTEGEVPAQLVERLNPAQREAVEHGAGQLLVIAGPGSGKTRVLTHRIAGLVLRGCPPWRILAVTFTNKAAAEMRERLVVLLGEDVVSRMWVGTFHSVCARILRTHHDKVGLPRAFSIADTDEGRRLITASVKDLNMALEPDEIRSIASKISRAKNAGLSPAVISERVKYAGDDNDVLARIWTRYDASLLSLGAVDFDDMLTRTAAVLQVPDVAQAYASRFAHVLVDEWQDTNAVQFDIARRLAAHGNLVAVGDARQAIYAFRGASAAAMDSFLSEYPGAHRVTLGQNYRSTPQIVAVSQAVLADAPEHSQPLWTDNTSGELVALHEAADDRSEAKWIVDRIRARLARGSTTADHAVLVRAAAQTRSLEQALRDAKLPYVLVGGMRFFDRAEIRDAVAWLRLGLNPSDAMAFSRAASAPKRGVGEATISALLSAARASGVPVLEVARSASSGERLTAGASVGEMIAARQRAGLAALVAAADNVAVACLLGAPAATRAAVFDTGLNDHHAAAKDGSGAERGANLVELVANAEQFAADIAAGGNVLTDVDAAGQDVPVPLETGMQVTEAFLEHVALYASASDADGTPADEQSVASSVAVMTTHASKGREFPHVYVAGVEDGFFPHSRSTTAQEVSEERRLLFVAFSRAMQTLSISRTRQRWAYGRISESVASPFLSDLPEDALERSSEAEQEMGYQQPRSAQRYQSPASKYRPQPSSRSNQSYSSSSSVGPKSSMVRSTAPAPAAGPRLDLETLCVGMRVRHTAFGAGLVTALSDGLVSVRFDGGRVRTLDPARAPMELED